MDSIGTGQRSRQSGMVLVYVTLTLVIALIVLPAILVFVGGADRTAQIREDNMLRIYAADAGIEEAFHKIVQGNLTDPEWDMELNGSNVTVQVTRKQDMAQGVYRILATATDWEGVTTTVEAYTAEQDYWSLFDNVISSPNDVELKKGANVTGWVALNGEMRGNGWPSNTKLRPEGLAIWPDAYTLETWYLGNMTQAGIATCSPTSSITVTEDQNLQALWTCGALDIDGKPKGKGKNKVPGTLTLLDTVFVTGDLTIGQSSGSKVNLRLNLNGQTIFGNASILVNSDCEIVGSGCIVARENLTFTPKMGTTEDDFVFCMAVEGQLTSQPNGTFYGSLAGNNIKQKDTGVMVKAGSKVKWVDYTKVSGGAGFMPNFPTSPEGGKAAAIISYTILDEPPD